MTSQVLVLNYKDFGW